MAIQAFLENWREMRDWCEETIRNRDFDDGVLHDGDRKLLADSHKWRSPSQAQLNYLGSIANRVLKGSDGWDDEDLRHELSRRKRHAKRERVERQKTREAARMVGPVQKLRFLRADMSKYRRKLTMAHALVLGLMYDRVRIEVDELKLSLADFVTECRLSKTAVCEVIEQLEAMGFVERERSSGGRNRRTIYRGIIRLAIERHPEIMQPVKQAGDTVDSVDSFDVETVNSERTVGASKLSTQSVHARSYSSKDHYSRPLSRAR